MHGGRGSERPGSRFRSPARDPRFPHPAVTNESRYNTASTTAIVSGSTQYGGRPDRAGGLARGWPGSAAPASNNATPRRPKLRNRKQSGKQPRIGVTMLT